ncbi:MAG: CAAX farnesyltransferase (FTase) subunit beta [Tremellales sp. Tagirdzhanova-0007]|nr:MAG: CAAX farnesyltransferase (FTase) subunit beta [Tremellales sp. Tagirdzhanova-0007]
MFTILCPSSYELPQTGLPTNSHPTATSTEQSETEQLIADLLSLTGPDGSSDDINARAAITLRKQEHNVFLASTLFRLPAGFVMLDASKPWLLFWTAHSLDLLGIALDQGTKNRSRAISTLLHYQSPLGGFAGGPSNTQLPHLLPTYASISSLAILGNATAGGGWEEVAANRQATYDFFMRCKRPDGSFVVCEGGETDVRGTYCLLVVATLLDLLTPELVHNVDTFISGCQTYEGGFACSAYPFEASRAAMAEAHGGYTSCSLLAHFLLTSINTAASGSILPTDFPSKIDVDAAVRWSVLMQGEAIEAGGFRGRSNKLVDGCYSWWVGGGFPVLEELARRELMTRRGSPEEELDHSAPPLFNRVALQEYVLVAAQREAGSSGGLRDKPGKRSDLYHTCNNLSGLSIAQHHIVHSPKLVASNRARFDPSKGMPAIKPTKPEGGWRSEDARQAVRREVWASALGWVERDEDEILIGGIDNRLNPTTPVFNILVFRLQPFINYFYGQER